MKPFIVIPAHNESQHIGKVARAAKKYGSVVVVDDGSRDDTSAEAKKAGVDVLQHLVNLGKGAALKTGCDYALREGAEQIVVIDADGQHSPGDIPRVLAALAGTDIVFTYRRKSRHMPLVLRLGNDFIQLSTALLFGIHIKDTQCGFRAFTKETYRKIRWVSNDYSVESEMIARAGKQKMKFAQVPIETVYVDRYKGTTPIDGVKIMLNLLRWRVQGR